MNEIPVVRHLLACNDIKIGQGNDVTLVGLIHTIRLQAGDDFPCCQPLLCLYSVLTNGRDRHTYEVELVCGVGHQETQIYKWGPIVRDLGKDPLAVRGFQMRFKNIIFSEPGQFEFRLWCDGTHIASEQIEVRDNK